MLTILILSASFYNVFAQDDDNINSLLHQLKQQNTDTVLADVYARLCYRYCTVNPDSAVWYGNKAMQLSVKVNYAKGIGDAYNNTGWAYYSKGDLIRAKELINKALDRFKKMRIKEFIAVPLANLATIYVDESDYPHGLSLYAEAFKYLEEAGDKTRAAEMLFSMGRIYNLEKNPAKARNYFQQAYDIHKKEGNEIYMAQALSSIANTYQREGNYDTVLYLYKKTIPVFLKHNDIYRTGNAYENIAGTYEAMKQYPEALQNMQAAARYYRQLNSKIDMAYAYNGLGDIYKETGDFERAGINYKKASVLAAQTAAKNLQRSIFLGLSGVYVKMNDYKNAYLLLDSSYKIKDSLFTKEKQEELLKLQTEFETERKENENKLLKTQNITASLQLERNRMWLAGAGIGLLMAGFLLYLLYRNRQDKIKNIQTLKELNVELEAQKEEISRMNSILELKALRAQMNPHFIFNCMSSIQECMLTGRVEDANFYLTKLSRLLRMVLNCSDEESVSLDTELQILTLYLQLEKLRLKNNFDFEIEIDEHIAADELQVPTLFLQPFAENAIWHGLVNKNGERTLTIKGWIKDDTLHFSITDNGIGRKKAAELKPEGMKNQSKGIELIQKRLSIINNKTDNSHNGFFIDDLYDANHIAAGTCVKIELPLIVI